MEKTEGKERVAQAVVRSEAGSADEPKLIEAYRARLAAELPGIRARMADALARSGRTGAQARLVAVTKGHPKEVLRAAFEAGLTDLGENRPELLEPRRRAFPEPGIRWHLIGHVQRRKAKGALRGADLFHALDSVRLAERLSHLAVEHEVRMKVLLQVNTSGEASKGGFDPSEALEHVDRLAALPGLEVQGMMTMAPFVADEGLVRTAFRRLRELHERARSLSSYAGTELSMGMTNDYEWALEEGSTMVRIGTALFGDRPQPPEKK